MDLEIIERMWFADSEMQNPHAENRRVRHPARCGVCPEVELLVPCHDFDGGVVPLIVRGRSIVDVHEGVSRGRRGCGLDPKDVASNRVNLLVYKRLATDGGSRDGPIPVIAGSEHPISCDDTGKWNVRRAGGCTSPADHTGSRSVGEGNDSQRTVKPGSHLRLGCNRDPA